MTIIAILNVLMLGYILVWGIKELKATKPLKTQEKVVYKEWIPSYPKDLKGVQLPKDSWK